MLSMIQVRFFGRRTKVAGRVSATKLGLSWLGLLVVSGMAHGFENLNAAQNLVYNTAHLSNTESGQQIRYQYQGQTASNEPIDDRVLLSITKAYADERRDVTVDFLSDEQHVIFPDFPGFRGNPVIITMLEHIAQSFGKETGGGVLYFRNRIRDSLAHKSTRVETVKSSYQDLAIDAKQIRFTPLADDTNLKQNPEYGAAVFSITLSDQVPGGVVSVTAESRQNDLIHFKRVISVD